MNQSRVYAVGIAAFILGGIAGGYYVPLLSRGDAKLREQVQQLNRQFENIAPRLLVPSIAWGDPPESNRPVSWILYAFVPPLAVAAIPGLWARAVFGSLSHLPQALNQLLIGRALDFKPESPKAFGKS